MNSKNKYSLVTSIKWLFASGALAAILGLWGWFANKTIQNTLQTNGNNTLQANVVVHNSNGQSVSGLTTITLQQVSAPVSGSTSSNPVVVTRTGSSRP
jgi:hypothetical protein